jgi:hypothetical protein
MPRFSSGSARSTAIMLVAVACVGLLALWWLVSDGVGDTADHPADSSPADTAAPRGEANAQATRVPQSVGASAVSFALPQPNVPIARELPALIRAAQAGDARAMCRLSFELNRCAVTLPFLRRAVESMADRLVDPKPAWSIPGRTEDDQLRALAERTAKRDDLEAICASVAPTPGLEPWRLLRDAARAGHIPSMGRFAAAAPFDPQRIYADGDAVKGFRDEAPNFLMRAAGAGDPQAAFLLVWAYKGSGSQIASTGRIPVDLGLSLAYALALDGVGNEETQKSLVAQIAKLRRQLTAAAQRQAEQRAAALRPRFAHSQGEGRELRFAIDKSDGKECEQPALSRVVQGPVPRDLPIAPDASGG